MWINSLIQQAVFYVFAFILIASSVMVITARNPVRGILFLILAFFASAALWLLLEAEFLALVLVVVYVGAVMTLFLFVVMMLDINLVPSQQGYVRFLPIGIVVLAALLVALIIALLPQHFGLVTVTPLAQAPNFSNTAALGQILYTTYLYPFELAGVLLLVAIISAISLAFRGRRQNTKAQKVHEQVSVRAKDRVRVVKMLSERKK